MEMENRIMVWGRDIGYLSETAMVAFNDEGRITYFKLYGCPNRFKQHLINEALQLE